MASIPAPTDGSELKAIEAASRLCPASCGASISGRDRHPMCIACMGAAHAQALLANPQTCPHCSSMPEKIRERRLRVAVANGRDPGLGSGTPVDTGDNHQPRASTNWADMMEEEPPLPPLFEGLVDSGLLEAGDDEAGGDANSDLLDLDMEEEEEDSTFPVQRSRPSSSTGVASQGDADLYEVCRRAAAKLNIQWPAAQGAEGVERDLYDGKRLPLSSAPPKQLSNREGHAWTETFCPHASPSPGECCKAIPGQDSRGRRAVLWYPVMYRSKIVCLYCVFSYIRDFLTDKFVSFSSTSSWARHL
ncbi:uncharacterized protein [Nothobranchius furzeri]|uniref:uncharacterized protein n=1 Tax=Nothobranchius furzeri TaxID=105023 RepID=UPI003904D813